MTIVFLVVRLKNILLCQILGVMLFYVKVIKDRYVIMRYVILQQSDSKI